MRWVKKSATAQRVIPDDLTTLVETNGWLVTDQLEEVYRSHRRGLFSLALSITGRRQAAEDAVHDAFVSLCRRSQPPTGSLVNYVFAAVRNAAYDTLRRTAKTQSGPLELFQHRIAFESAESEPSRLAERAEREQLLQSAVLSLDDSAREVVILKTYAGLTFDAIGEIVSEPSATVATRYRRALQKLQDRLRGQV